MCGIAGFCLNPEAHNTTEQHEIAASMLLDIEHRGYHATGAAWTNADSRKLWLLKHNMPAHKYVDSVGDRLCDGATTAILHTRWATQGDPSNNDNNHPITRGKIALTHNGHISNDKELFKRLGVHRRAQVDSEAATALLAFTHDNYHPTEVLGQIEGTAALAWFNYTDKHNTLHLARVNSSPLYIGQSKAGHIFYASTLEAIRNAAWFAFDELEWEHAATEGEYFRITDGVVAEFARFKRNAPQIYGMTANWKEVAYDKAALKVQKRQTEIPMPF